MEDSCHVGMERIADVVRDESLTILGAEDEVDVKTGKGLRHGLGRPFRAWMVVGPQPRALPWAGMERTVGAGEVVFMA